MNKLPLALSIALFLPFVSVSMAAAPQCASYRNDGGDRLAFVYDGENTVIYTPANARCILAASETPK